MLDDVAKEKLIAVMMYGNNKAQSMGFFRTAIGLYYLSKIMVEDELDFRAIDKAFNRFIFKVIGRGHSITSILQFLGSKKVLWVLDSKSFVPTFLNYFSDISFSKMQILLTVNLNVSKKISKLSIDGPLKDWLIKQSSAEALQSLQDNTEVK
ncbi:MAG: hypothetical protein C4516_10470 [Oxalobacter sp.]|nr:MAG: hypothetical protein C4516_10470 [Oxalobacter sp.]